MENEEIENAPVAQIPANDAPQIDMKAFNEIKSRLDKIEAKANRPRITGDANGPADGGRSSRRCSR